MKTGRTRTLKSAKYLEKRKKRFMVNLSIYIGGSILALVILVFIIRLPFFQINSVEIKGATTLNNQEIEKTVRESLLGDYLYIIPKSNFLFYPKSNILSQVFVNYKKIDSATIHIKSLSNLVLDITERIPEVITCEGFKEDENDNSCFFADSDGYVFEKVSDVPVGISNGVYFKYYVNSTLNPVTIGSPFIIKSRFLELQKFVKDINNSGIKTTGLLVTDDGSYELYVSNMDQSTAVVYFDDRSSFDKTLSNFVIFWQNALDKKVGVKDIPIFDYINLRFGNNVFYLVKEGSKQNGTTTKQQIR